MMKESTSIRTISEHLPDILKRAVLAMRSEDISGLTEIRLRSTRSASLVYPDKVRFLCGDGSVTSFPNDTRCIVAAPEIMTETADLLCHYSRHSCQRELSEGAFSLGGGVRAGVSGKYSAADGKTLTDISSVNFRISRSVTGCADEVFNISDLDVENLLICGGVNSGKTTVLRDLCRQWGDIRKTALIDERNEISAFSGGQPHNDVGEMTDIIVGCERWKGINSAVRSMSPDIIFCDEIADDKDAEALLKAHGCGVHFAATIHAGDMESLMQRAAAKALISEGVFRRAVFLQGSSAPGKIREVRRLR